MPIRVPLLGIVGLSLAAAVAAAVPAGEGAPDYTPFKQAARVPFARRVVRATVIKPSTAPSAPAATRPAVDFDHLSGMNVLVRINGGRPLSFLVDTGSVGMVVHATDVPDIVPGSPKGEMVYSSSGNGYYGVWTPCRIEFVDAVGPDGKPVVAEVPVLAADEYRFTPGAVNGGGKATTQTSRTKHPYMFGVGFGRGKDPHPERNPFLNLQAMRAGTMRRGYTITRDGFTLGLAGRNIGAGYRFQKLAERTVSDESARLSPGLRDWATSRGWIVVDGRREAEVPILIDTGLTNFMIPTFGLAANTEVPRGTRVEVDLLGGQQRYTFAAAEAKDPPSADPTVPLKVTRYPTTNPSANVNTGLRTLAIYDYLYDADGGYLGLRQTAAHP